MAVHYDVSSRYLKKNPYELNLDVCTDPLPDNVGFFDIVNYCVQKDSPYTNDSFKSYKALDAYKYFDNGRIRNVACLKQAQGFIVVSKVSLMKL